MNELQEYVDTLFRRQRDTAETTDLKEEILSNMTAKRDDLLAHGMDETTAVQKAKESLLSIEGLVEGNQLTYIDRNEKVQEKLNAADFVEKFYSAKPENLTAMYETQDFLEAFINNNYAAKFILYAGTPVDMETADFQETLVMGNNASNSTSSPNGKKFRVLIRGDEQKTYMIDDENKIYAENNMDNVAHIQYVDFIYAESGTENINGTECVFDTYIGKQLLGGDSSAISLTLYLRADDHTIYALKTARETSAETILIKEMQTTVDASDLECPSDYEKVDNDTFNQSLF